MSINKLSNECSVLKDSDKFQLICDLVGDMPAKSIKGLVKTVEDTFDVKVERGSKLSQEQLNLYLKPPSVSEPPPTEFDLVLTAPGSSKLPVIRQVRALTSLALREAKRLVDTVPSVLSKALPESDAQALKQVFEDLGATVEVVASKDA
ncbi:MAG: ribosomal protein L7/L12 [Planctomycetota bacterium]|nr:ribosomal protein L7/L12 [Planctomycetota bacterium]